MPPKKKLLVTGASGFLGWNVCRVAHTRFEVHGTCNTHTTAPGYDTIPHIIDLCNNDTLADLFAQIHPDAVIHTAAAADPNFCQSNPEVSHRINVIASADIAALCSQRGIPFVFTSSDLVFDGRNAPYKEDNRVSPASLYGEQKAMAEQSIMKVYPLATVCRMPLMYGDAPAHAKSFIHPMISAIVAHNELKLFTDEFRTPCCAIDAAEGLLLAAEKRYSGILHLGGPERLSRYDIGILLGKALGITPNIRPTRQIEVPMSAPRPPDVSMNSQKAQALGFAPRRMAERLPQLSIIHNYSNKSTNS